MGNVPDWRPLIYRASPLNRREQRALAIVREMAIRPFKSGWKAESQTKDREYKVSQGHCTCPDDGEVCKHVLSVEFLVEHIETLMKRLGIGETLQDAERTIGSDIPQMVETLEARYQSLLAGAAEYRSPSLPMCCSFRLEAIGDDAYQAKRMSERQGRVFVPSHVRELKPERPWIAKITGVDIQYEFRREFMAAHTDYREADKYGKRGVWLYYCLPAGLYEVYELTGFTTRKRYFMEVSNLKTRKIGKERLLECLRSRPN